MAGWVLLVAEGFPPSVLLQGVLMVLGGGAACCRIYAILIKALVMGYQKVISGRRRVSLACMILSMYSYVCRR